MTPTERDIDEILNNFRQTSIIIHANDSLGRGEKGAEAFASSITQAKQALTSLIKELVVEAKPSKKYVGDEVAENRSYTGERLFNATIDEFEQNLLKALEEK